MYHLLQSRAAALAFVSTLEGFASDEHARLSMCLEVLNDIASAHLNQTRVFLPLLNTEHRLATAGIFNAWSDMQGGVEGWVVPSCPDLSPDSSWSLCSLKRMLMLAIRGLAAMKNVERIGAACRL